MSGAVLLALLFANVLTLVAIWYWAEYHADTFDARIEARWLGIKTRLAMSWEVFKFDVKHRRL